MVGEDKETGRIHTLKIWPRFFDLIDTGRKMFEVRKDDRDFLPGDLLYLHEYEHLADRYTGRLLTVRVLTVVSLRPFYDAVGMDIEKIDRSVYYPITNELKTPQASEKQTT